MINNIACNHNFRETLVLNCRHTCVRFKIVTVTTNLNDNSITENIFI